MPLESLAPMTACGELRETGAHERHAVEHPSLLAARDRCAQAHVLCTWSDEVCRVSQRLCRTSAVRRQSAPAEPLPTDQADAPPACPASPAHGTRACRDVGRQTPRGRRRRWVPC